GDNEDVGRKVIVISSCLLEDIDFVTKIALLDTADKCVSVDFVLLEKVSRCHGYPLDDEDGNKLVKSTSCLVTCNELAVLDLIRNSLKVGEHSVLLMPSFHYYIKLQHATSPFDFNIIERTNIGSLSEVVKVSKLWSHGADLLILGAEKYTQTSITPIVVSDYFRNLDFPLESLYSGGSNLSENQRLL
ncbi:hypothetical protein Tco_0809375, partial [Tanacetum coccineum]